MEKQAKILIVDDEEDMRQLLLQFIELAGFEAEECADGQEALERLERDGIDVVLSDLVMPRLDGIELLQQLNEKGWTKPFILLTGHGSEELARKALQLGAYDFVDKPFDHKHLTSILRGAVKLSQEIAHHEMPDQEIATSQDILPKAQFIDFIEVILKCDTSAAAKQKFIDQSLDNLTFCKAAVKNLHDEKARKIELGYLLRVMRDFTQQAQYCGFFDLSAFAAMVTECLIYYRSRPEKLYDEEIKLFTEVIYFLLKYLKVVDNQKSMQYLFLRISEKMDILCQSFTAISDEMAAAG